MDIYDITQKVIARQKLGKKHIHSEHHALADKLAKALEDPKHFGAYLKIAQTHSHARLLQILGQVLDNPKAQSKPKLFMYLVKKENNDRTRI